MEFGLAVLKLPHHTLDAPINRGMIRAVARDELQNDRGKRVSRKLSVWDLHRWAAMPPEVLQRESAITLPIVAFIRNDAAVLRYTNSMRTNH